MTPHRCSPLLALAFTVSLALSVSAQVTDTTPAPRDGDVSTISAIIPALYASISGPAGQPRDWPRFFGLVHPAARLIPTRCKAAAQCEPRILSPLEYRQRADSFLVTEGFSERELSRQVERYGAIAQVFSSYASFRRGESTPFARGINSIQLYYDGKRWWVMNILWDGERPDNPLPAEMTSSH